MRQFAETSMAISVIAESGTGIAGFIIVHLEPGPDRPTAYIVTIDVAPDRLRNGLGTRLVAHAERLSNEALADRMQLHVHVNNSSAIAFYEASGYVRIGHDTAFYGKQRDIAGGAYVYEKCL